ncbi:MAG: alanyl-tRNA editing protein [Faecalibacterium sp.]|nr:alanyl-tRNA editing protein [Faecalibacterium sp.]
MHNTIKLYERDAEARRCTATVQEIRREGAATRLALDATLFFAEGGGQPADRGTITFRAGTARVTDVHENEGVLWHTVADLPETAAVGDTVTCEVDWAWRFDKMQQHSGEHILSGILHRLYGAENVGFHIGAEIVRMDTSCPLSADELRRAEAEANAVIWQDVPVEVTYPTPERLAQLTYRSKKEIEGQVRIVSIPGADVCACCGTHVRTTGQVGLIKIVAAEHYKGGERLTVLCGGRALAEMQAMRARQADIGALLSAKSDQTAVAVHRVYEEYTALKFAHFNMAERLFAALAAGVKPGCPAILTLPALSPDELHRLAEALSGATDALCAALTPNEKGIGYCLARQNGDVRALAKALNETFSGRGGGKPAFCQGSCAAGTPPELEAFLRAHAEG